MRLTRLVAQAVVENLTVTMYMRGDAGSEPSHVDGHQAHSVVLVCIVEQHEASSEHGTGRTRDWTTWDSPQRFSSLPAPLRG